MQSEISKAIAGGLVGAVLTTLAHYGLQPKGSTVTAIGVIVTAVVGYVVGHIAVYLAPPNQSKPTSPHLQLPPLPLVRPSKPPVLPVLVSFHFFVF